MPPPVPPFSLLHPFFVHASSFVSGPTTFSDTQIRYTQLTLQSSKRPKGAFSSIWPIDPIVLDVTVITSWIFPLLNASSQVPILKSPTPIQTIFVTILLMRISVWCRLQLNNVHIWSPATRMWVIALVKFTHIFHPRRASFENMYKCILGSLCMVPFRSLWYRTRQMLLFNLHSHVCTPSLWHWFSAFFGMRRLYRSLIVNPILLESGRGVTQERIGWEASEAIGMWFDSFSFCSWLTDIVMFGFVGW